MCLLLLGPGLVWTLRGLTDFMPLYAGAKLCFTHDQYNAARVLATEFQATRYSSPHRLFVRLPAFGLVLWPISGIPYPAASALWEGLCAIAFTAFAALWRGDRRVIVHACCWSLPLLPFWVRSP